jgi:hypothetical protein
MHLDTAIFQKIILIFVNFTVGSKLAEGRGVLAKYPQSSGLGSISLVLFVLIAEMPHGNLCLRNCVSLRQKMATV